jgi:non-heme chloroperoxidase
MSPMPKSATYRRAVMLTYRQFRYCFVNAAGENEARRLYEAYPAPGSRRPSMPGAVGTAS